MEIHVNGKPVAKVDEFVRSVSISGDEGAITRFDTAPTTRVLNIVTEHRVDSNAPRLDEIEFLQYVEALESGALSGDPDGDDTPLNEQLTERISESEYEEPVDPEETEETSSFSIGSNRNDGGDAA